MAGFKWSERGADRCNPDRSTARRRDERLYELVGTYDGSRPHPVILDHHCINDRYRITLCRFNRDRGGGAERRRSSVGHRQSRGHPDHRWFVGESERIVRSSRDWYQGRFWPPLGGRPYRPVAPNGYQRRSA